MESWENARFQAKSHGTGKSEGADDGQRKIGTITYKALRRELKEMEADGLVRRKEYPQVPPKVEYSLTEKGASLYPIMEQMCQWGTEHSRDK